VSAAAATVTDAAAD